MSENKFIDGAVTYLGKPSRPTEKALTSPEDAVNSFDRAIAAAKVSGKTPELRRIAASALSSLSKNASTTGYMKKNVLPRMRAEFSEVFGDDMTESGQALREVSAYRLGKRFGKAAIAAATGAGQKASGAAKTDIIQRGGKSVSVRRDIGGAGGGQFVNALTAMRQSMERATTLGKRAERVRRLVGSRDRPLFSELPSDPIARSDEIRKRQIERLRGVGGKTSLTKKQKRERAARRKADEERRKAEEEKRRADLLKKAEEEREKQRIEDEKAKERAEEERRRQRRESQGRKKTTVRRGASPRPVSGQTGNTDISKQSDLYVPSEIAIISGANWKNNPSYETSVKAALARVDSLLVLPSARGFGNPSLGTGIVGIPVLLRKVNSYSGQYRWNSFTGKSDITISSTSANPAMTMLHEFGHYLDNELFVSVDDVFSETNAASAVSGFIPEMDAVIDAISRSDGFKRLIYGSAALRSRPSQFGSWGNYYGDRREMWARAFAQWALLRSDGNVEMWTTSTRKQIGGFLATVLGQSFNTQWEDPDDFAPIATAIDELFEAAGWLK